MSQTSVSLNISEARAGLLAYPGRDCRIDSFAAEGACRFGYIMVEGTATNQVKEAAATSDTVKGIAVATNAIENDSDGSDPGYNDEDTVNTLVFGEVWMPYDGTAPSVGDTALYVDVDGGTKKLTLTSTSNLSVNGLKVKKVNTTLGLVLVSTFQAL